MSNFRPGQIGGPLTYQERKQYTEQQRRSAEEAVTAANEMVLDGFKNDPLYIAAFNHGDFGAIEDADFETFGEVKTYIADTIFATEHQGQRKDNNADYTPSDGDGPKYLDVSEYYEDRELSLPAIYKEPAEIQMPASLQQYNTNVAKVPEKLEFGDKGYPVTFEDTGYPDPSAPEETTTKKKVAPEWRDKRRWRRNVKEIIGKDQDWKEWAKAAGVSNLNSKSDSDKIEEFFNLHNGVLPT